MREETTKLESFRRTEPYFKVGEHVVVMRSSRSEGKHLTVEAIVNEGWPHGWDGYGSKTMSYICSDGYDYSITEIELAENIAEIFSMAFSHDAAAKTIKTRTADLYSAWKSRSC